MHLMIPVVVADSVSAVPVGRVKYAESVEEPVLKEEVVTPTGGLGNPVARTLL